MSTDPHRPIYHFMPPANWMNDPNGLIQWKGQYHLFYQHYPGGAFWSTMHWGHAVSADLVHWTHLPIAMTPTPGSPDEDGCWSGCAVNHNGTPTVIYTGLSGGAQLPCLATSRDDLLTWDKYAGNPIITSPPPGCDVPGFRDHCVWRENGEWRMIIGSGINGVGGAAFLYRSPDLLQWRYMAPLCIGDKNHTGQMWECPDFFPLGHKHVLVISALPAGKVLYLTGAYAGDAFVPEKQGSADDGCFYAPLSMTDSTGRRLMWGWLREERIKAAQIAAGWSGVMSLPRVLSLLPDGTLSARPVPEIECLRGRPYHLEDVELSSGSNDLLSKVKGDALEMLAEFEPGDVTRLGLQMVCSPDGVEHTDLVYDPTRSRLTMDRSHSSVSDTVQCEEQGDTLALAPQETLQLRVFLDKSVLEIFANGRFCLASRVYPARADSLGFKLFVQGGCARIKSLDIWPMRSIW